MRHVWSRKTPRARGRRSPIRRGGGRGRKRQRRAGGPPGWIDRAGAGRRAGLLPLADAGVLDRLRGRCPAGRPRAPRTAAGRHGSTPRTPQPGKLAGFSLPPPPSARCIPLGFNALRLRQQARVQKKLQQRLALPHSGPARIEHLVGPSAQRTRPVHPEQEVGIAAPPPAVVLQAPLVDHVGPAAYGFPRARGGRRGVPVREPACRMG